MLNTLIIKLGAMGDVLRTTPLLRVISGNVYWLTQKDCIPLLALSNNLKKVIDINYTQEQLQNISFDLVICLDDDIKAAELAAKFNDGSLIGSFVDGDGKLSYTQSAKEWFDMGLISKLGKQRGDDFKKRNKKTYQEIIFRMIGKKFSGEEYVINFDGKPKINKKNKERLIGIENRADRRWPTKQWNKYEQLSEILRKDGLRVKFFQQRETIHEYINDLSGCDLIITGDTLALHIALALKIKVVAIFTCTSPAEIYDYSRMVKVVSPALDKAFYSMEYIKEAVDAVSLESVYGAVKKFLW
jgi:heptosyltransferase-2